MSTSNTPALAISTALAALAALAFLAGAILPALVLGCVAACLHLASSGSEEDVKQAQSPSIPAAKADIRNSAYFTRLKKK